MVGVLLYYNLFYHWSVLSYLLGRSSVPRHIMKRQPAQFVYTL